MYLQTTAFLPIILKADGKGTSLYIDGAHAVHADMKGHAGVYVNFGKGTPVYAASTKNKLNTVSSTETEVVSVGKSSLSTYDGSDNLQLNSMEEMTK